jgi:hypothetical protein
MPATGSSGNQWYAFKVTEKRATQLKVDATKIKSGTTTATVYCGSKQVGTTTLTNGAVNYINITYSTTYGSTDSGITGNLTYNSTEQSTTTCTDGSTFLHIVTTCHHKDSTH